MADMYIKCKNCKHKETLNKRFFVKAIGGAFAGGGFYAWVAYIFAGTGFAMAICVAIIAGGVAMAAFSDEIAEWVSKKYDCPRCKRRVWMVVKE